MNTDYKGRFLRHCVYKATNYEFLSVTPLSVALGLVSASFLAAGGQKKFQDFTLKLSVPIKNVTAEIQIVCTAI